MSEIDNLIEEIQQQNRDARQQQHSQTFTMNGVTHNKLTKLSEYLQLSKTNLGSKLLAAAVDEAYAKVVEKSGSSDNQTKTTTPTKKSTELLLAEAMVKGK